MFCVCVRVRVLRCACVSVCHTFTLGVLLLSRPVRTNTRSGMSASTNNCSGSVLSSSCCGACIGFIPSLPAEGEEGDEASMLEVLVLAAVVIGVAVVVEGESGLPPPSKSVKDVWPGEEEGAKTSSTSASFIEPPGAAEKRMNVRHDM